MGIPLLIIGAGAGKSLCQSQVVGWKMLQNFWNSDVLGVAIWLPDRVLNPTVIMFLWSFYFWRVIYLKMYKHIFGVNYTCSFFLGVVLFVGAISGATNPLKL